MIAATSAPSVHTCVGESPMETAVDGAVTTAVGVAVETAGAVETVGVPTMRPGTGVLMEVEDIVDC